MATVQAAADAIRAAVVRDRVPEDVRAEIAGTRLRRARRAPPVAVRSSAVGEDSGEATFAGQQETYLWVRGADGVCDAVRDCWASTYSAPAMTLPGADGRRPARPRWASTVQLMVDAAVSGVMFTCNPVSGDPSVVAINASWGLGLAVVGGEVTPDEYLVSQGDRRGRAPQTSAPSTSSTAPTRRASGTGACRSPRRAQAEPCLDDEQLAALVDVARRVQRTSAPTRTSSGRSTPTARLFVAAVAAGDGDGGEEGRGRDRRRRRRCRSS